jgi:hypothetical protein
MILCHKDAGLLAARKDENVEGLLSCGCMSGWVRGFEPDLTREQAVAVQIKMQDSWIALYTTQKRADAEIEKVRQRKIKLEALLVNEGGK